MSAVAARAVLAGVAGGNEAGLRRRALRSEHSAPLPAAAGPAAMRRRQHLGRLPLLRGPTWARRCSTHRWAPLPPTSSSSPNTTPTLHAHDHPHRTHLHTHTHCRDIRKLDCAKRNLTNSITLLKRLAMLASAITGVFAGKNNGRQRLQ